MERHTEKRKESVHHLTIFASSKPHKKTLPGAGFEPAKHYALHLKCNPFDHSGNRVYIILLSNFIYKSLKPSRNILRTFKNTEHS
jgi:hypothetical protein